MNTEWRGQKYFSNENVNTAQASRLKGKQSSVCLQLTLVLCPGFAYYKLCTFLVVHN